MTDDNNPTDGTDSRMTRRALMTGIGATAVTPAFAGTASATPWSSDPEALSPTLQTARGWFAPNLLGQTVRYGGDGHSTFVVTVEDGKMETFHDWLNESSSRHHVRDISPTRAVVALPESHLFPGVFSTSNPLSTLSYIENVDLNLRVTVDPVRSLSREREWTRPRLYRLYSGDFSATGLAFDDVERAQMADLREMFGLDDLEVSGESVRVSVVDTGVNDPNGELFSDRLVGSKNFISGEEGLDSVRDRDGHGTWVASAIANGADGIAPGCELLVARALGDNGRGELADIVEAIEWSVEEGADIVNLSLGTPIYSDVLAEVVSDAVESGVVVVAAVGNSRMTTRWVASPADTPTPGVVSVAATEYSENVEEIRPAYFANTGVDEGLTNASIGATSGATVDVAAPGMALSTTTYTSTGSERESVLSGTSMAAPVVAGAVALLMDADASMKGEPEEVADAIARTATPLPEAGKTEVGAGLINPAALVADEDSDGDQESIRTSTAEARDIANRSYGGSWADRWFTPVMD